VFLASLPKGVTGKVLRKALRDLEPARAASQGERQAALV
jgi:hypothetical protein